MAEMRGSVSAKEYIKVFVKRFTDDAVPDLAAQLAYYFLLSLFPFLIFTLALISYLPIPLEHVIELVKRFAPAGTIDLFNENLKSESGGLLSFGVILTIWTASNAINAMIRALNRAYNVDESRPFFVARGLAILLTFGMILAIVVALVLPVFGKVLGDFIFVKVLGLSGVNTVWLVLRWLISFLIIVTVIACLYFFAPNKKLYWKDVLFGAVVAAVGWQAVSLGFSYYVSNFGNYEAIYGSLGGIIILMIWFYLTAVIIIVGGELNAVNKYFEKHR